MYFDKLNVEALKWAMQPSTKKNGKTRWFAWKGEKETALVLDSVGLYVLPNFAFFLDYETCFEGYKISKIPDFVNRPIEELIEIKDTKTETTDKERIFTVDWRTIRVNSKYLKFVDFDKSKFYIPKSDQGDSRPVYVRECNKTVAVIMSLRDRNE